MITQKATGFDRDEIEAMVRNSLSGKGKLGRILLLPPDYTRMYSGAGMLTAMYYRILTSDGAAVDVMPALGTHAPMTRAEAEIFFEGSVPFGQIIGHDWRGGVVKLGEVPAAFVSEVSEGLVSEKIDVEVNRLLTDGKYDLIISLGQVVPHEVVGMANYSKNIFVGCGGSSMISSSHMLGAFYGMERIMGLDFSPVRRVFDYAEQHFIAGMPLMYVLTVTTNRGDDVFIHGLWCGRSRTNFEEAVALSRQKNLTFVERPLKKVIVNLDEREFKSTWLGNKAIYRTRMAIADGGELIVLAPGIRKFGEDDENDRLIRKYGYVGRANVLKLVEENDDLKNNLSVAAHLIHGSSDGRFSVTYAARHLTKEEVTGASFGYMPLDEAKKRWNTDRLTDGFNIAGGEEIFYISNPALGLWSV